MAKKPSAAGNKSQAIRDALAAHPDKSPKEIAEILTAKGFKVTAAYVSIIKYNLSKSRRKQGMNVVFRRKIGQPAGPGRTASLSGVGTMEAAVHLVHAAGGLDQAREALAVLESIRATL